MRSPARFIAERVPAGETSESVVATDGRASRRSRVHDVEGVRALPGALELLAGQRPVAIVTSCTEALAKARTRAAGLPLPRVLVTADAVE